MMYCSSPPEAAGNSYVNDVGPVTVILTLFIGIISPVSICMLM